MNRLSPELKNEVLNKKSTLENAKVILKAEFVGLDRVIDDLIESFSYWYYFPELQKKPVVINLWGLTGVGKTSLVNRLIQLLNFEQHFYPFNLCESDWDIKDTIAELYEKQNNRSFIMMFDEFQNVRTINEGGNEKHTKYQYLWELLDTGKIPVIQYPYHLNELHRLELKLRKLLQLGVLVKGGMVVGNEALFKTEMGTESGRSRRSNSNMERTDIFFVPEEFHDIIFELYSDYFSLTSEVATELKAMNGPQTIKFLKEVILHSMATKYLDCSQSLIFIVGNLDEAYKMAHNFDIDISANEFHEQSLKITLPQIKSALKVRFRSEQIARLGNNHIIYPALDEKSYCRLIELELQKVKKEVHSQFGINLEFDESVHQLLYREGVYPTQGTRPLFSSIHQVINTQIPKIVYHLLQVKEPIDSVKIDCESKMMNFRFYADDSEVYHFQERMVLSLEKLRKNKRDEMQAICAVHESGHAILSSVLLKCIPELIYSSTSGVDKRGFVFAKLRWDYVSKGEMINRVATLLGGYAAEKLVFGDENLTNGSESDIVKATGLVCDLLKNCGMGSLPAAFQIEDIKANMKIYDPEHEINNQAKEIIQAGLLKAQATLVVQKKLLLKMSEYLADNRCMQKDQITQMVTENVVGMKAANFEKTGESNFYRKLLKQQLHTLESKTEEFASEIEGVGYSLNSNQPDNL
jgi:hypothetical protein